jgi:hypothetical protein
MALFLYAVAATALLALAQRFVRPISKWAAVILFLVPFVIAGRALLTDRAMVPADLPYMTVPLNWMKAQHGIGDGNISSGIHSDVYSQFVPWRKAVQWSLAHGEWGLWNRFSYPGDILLAGEQPAVYSPITLLAVLLPATLSFTFTGALTLFIAALTMFLFARELECREGTALIAGAGWCLGSSVVLFLHVAMGASWSWAPLVLLGVRRVVREKTIPILAAALTMLVASAHSESALLIVILGVAYGLFEIVSVERRPPSAAESRTVSRLRLRRPRAGAAPQVIARACIAGLIALLFNAIHLLPFLEAMPLSMEYAHRQNIYRFEPHGVPVSHVLARASTTFIPYLHGRDWKLADVAPPSYITGAVGSILLALALYALWRKRSRETWFFGAIFLFCLVAGAEWKPLATLLGNIPLLDLALYDRFALGAALALAILGALGVEEIVRRDGDRAAAWTLLGTLGVIAFANAWAVRTQLVDHGDMHFGAHVVFAEIALLAFAAAILFQRRAIVPLLLATILLQRAISLDGLQKSFPQQDAYPPIPMLDALKHVEVPFRVVGHGKAMLAATSTMYELEDARGFSAVTLQRLRDTFSLWSIEQPVWFNRVDDLTRPFLSFLNVRYAVTWDRDPPPDGWREVSGQRGSMLIENTRALSRAFVPRSVRVGERDAIAEMKNERDFGERAWIESNDKPYERTNGPGTVTVENAKLGYVIDANMQGDGWVVASITAWPGWRAYVDGQRLQTQIANHAFLSVHVPAGNHRIVLKYWPASFVIGRAITATMFIAVIALALLNRLKALFQRRDPSLVPLPLGE